MSSSPHTGSPRSTTKPILKLAATVFLGCLVLWIALAGLASASTNSQFNTLRDAGNRDPEGIWSDGQTMWVADSDDAKIYAYSMATKERAPQKEFDTLDDAGNRSPRGIWSNGQTMWVADANDDRVYAYSMTTKERDEVKDFDLWNVLGAFGNVAPEGIWSDSQTVWVADGDHVEKIYAYSLRTKLRVPAKELSLWNRNMINIFGEGNAAPRGIWSDGQTMWIADDADQVIYAYSLSTNERLPHKEFTSLKNAGNGDPSGIWSDGRTMWVADERDDKIYAYPMPIELGNTVPSIDRLADQPPSMPIERTIAQDTYEMSGKGRMDSFQYGSKRSR